MARNEADLSYQLRTDISEVYGSKAFVHLLPDMWRTGKKPFDFFVLNSKRFYAFETKFNKGNTYNVDNAVKPHQPQCLIDIRKAGGHGYFLFYFKKEDALLKLSPLFIKEGMRFKFCDYPEDFRVMRLKIDGRKRWQVEKLFLGISIQKNHSSPLIPNYMSTSSIEIPSCVKSVDNVEKKSIT